MRGPAPDPNALRRDRPDDKATWLQLPRHHPGKAPRWPLTECSERELDLWHDLWTMPQASMWLRNRQQLEVAVYVSTLRDLERVAYADKGYVAHRTLVLKQMNSLGLTTEALNRLRWRIAADDTAEPEATPSNDRRRPLLREITRIPKATA
jgi:hypothetical protein